MSRRSGMAAILAAIVSSICVVAGAAKAQVLPSAARSAPTAPATTFDLPNGLTVVVIPDTRLPVVTHMVFYRVGGADEPPGKSGMAHFLEHLMFKATARIKSGEFSRIISRLGATDNAVTMADHTYYHQRAARDRLKQLMQLEADRMTGLKFDDVEIGVERKVVLEERRTSIEAQPLALLSEQMLTLLYANHPYRTPVIGWPHEVAMLTRADLEGFYRRHYAPNNAIVVVAGDVTEAEVRALAAETSGAIPAAASLPARMRPAEPAPRGTRHVWMTDERATSPTLVRFYATPSQTTALGNGAASLEILAHILGQGETSRLTEALVDKGKVALVAAAQYSGNGRDGGRIAVFALPAPGVSVAKLEAELDAALEAFVAAGPTKAEVDLARDSLEAKRVFETDSQFERARRIGESLVLGRSLADVLGDGARLATVTADDVKAVAQSFLVRRNSVTGVVAPAPEQRGVTP